MQISIHALREEGDKSRLCSLEGAGISIHALREEGDADQEAMKLLQTKFLSTPSARRATSPRNRCRRRVNRISIHTLREEGDLRCAESAEAQTDFYPRPPRGGRRGFTPVPHQSGLFLSTPSARRATCAIAAPKDRHSISIHALREEGDKLALGAADVSDKFLSTPSARRATYVDGEDILAEVFLSTPSARRATYLFV